MEGAMLERGPHGCPLLHPLLRAGREIGLDKPLPEVIDGLLRGMEHVGRIEAVVAEFVVQQLIGGKIGHTRPLGPHHLVGSKEERGLGELAAVVAILAIADRTDSQHDTHPVVLTAQDTTSLAQCVGTGRDTERTLFEEALGPLLAVIDDLARGTLHIDAVGAQREHHDIGRTAGFCTEC